MTVKHGSNKAKLHFFMIEFLMGIWLYIPGGIYAKEKKNCKRKILIAFSSLTSNSLINIVNLQLEYKGWKASQN